MKAIDLKEIFEHGQDENIQAYLNFLDPIEIVDIFYLIENQYHKKVIQKLDINTLAAIFPFFEKVTINEIVEFLSDAHLCRVINEMETDDAAYMVRMLSKPRRYDIIQNLEKRKEIEKILSFPRDSAGSIMQTELCILRDGITIKQAIDSIRIQKRMLGEVFHGYIIDEERKLLGLVSLDDLLLGSFSENLNKIRKPLKHYILPEEDREEAARIFSRYDLRYLPVVDRDGILLGQITYDDIQDVVEEEASEDLLAYVGVSPEESIIDLKQNNIKLALGRFPWLVFSISASLLTGYILTFFEAQTSNAILFASFVPLIMNTTGNVGTQTAMIITRSFALGTNEFGDFRLPILREFSVGLILGLMAGSLTCLLVGLIYSDMTIGLRVGLTLIVSMTTAALFGMFIPIGFNKIGVDPAIASGPLVTSGCDMLSVTLYLFIIVGLKTFF